MAEWWSNLRQRRLMSLRARAVWLMPFLTFLAITGCSAPVTSFRSAPTQTPFPTPKVIPTITPNETATPFPSVSLVDQTAGSKSIESPNWTGVAFPMSGVTGVQAQWREPLVTNPADESDAALAISVGVGGYDDPNNIVEVGTFVSFPPNSAREEGVFYQMIPAQSKIQPPGISVSAGDYLFAEVVEVNSSPQQWRLLLVDANNGATFDRTVQFDSMHTDPDVIVGDPS